MLENVDALAAAVATIFSERSMPKIFPLYHPPTRSLQGYDACSRPDVQNLVRCSKIRELNHLESEGSRQTIAKMIEIIHH